MAERISPRQFHASDGVEDWRVVFDGAQTYFATGSFAKGVELVEVIGRLADAANHHPDVDLRYAGVTVSLFTHEVGDISDRDVALAQQISIAARERGIAAALAAGGRIVTDAHAPSWWTLADAEGNEVDVAPWREDSD